MQCTNHLASPLTCSDYRPISIIPILVRLMKKLVVSDFLYPILVHPDHCHLFLPRSFCTLDELREDADEQRFFSSRYNPNHVLHRLLPNPKELTTICTNAPTTLLYLRTAILLWNRILFIEWFLKTVIDFLPNVQCYFTKHFYSDTFIVL